MSIYKRARLLSVAAFAAALIGSCAAPVLAEEAPATVVRSHDAARRSTTSLATVPAPAAALPHPAGAGFLNGFVYSTGPQSLGIRGRLNVGKSGVYVPYYGNVDTDPLHPNVESVTGIGYGFRGFDLSVQNGALSPAPPPPNIPGGQPPKANPQLQFSIRF